MNSLKQRIQILKTLQIYASTNDMASIFRYMHNCNNNSMLNDGLNFAGACLASTGQSYLQS